MEAANIGAREADVAPAPETPGDGGGPRQTRAPWVSQRSRARRSCSAWSTPVWSATAKPSAVACCRWWPRWRSPTAASLSSPPGSGSSGPGTRSGRWRSARTARSGSRSTSSSSRVGKNVADSEVFSGLGLYLWMWGIFTAYMFIASLRTTGAVAWCSYCWRSRSSSSASATPRWRELCPSPTARSSSVAGSASITALVAWYASFAGSDQLDIRPGRCSGRSAPALTRGEKSQRRASLVVELGRVAAT